MVFSTLESVARHDLENISLHITVNEQVKEGWEEGLQESDLCVQVPM